MFKTPASPIPTLAPRGHCGRYTSRARHPSASERGLGEGDEPFPRPRCPNQIAKAGYRCRSRIRYERVITPADWDTRYEIYRGATFNLAHTLDQMLHLRPNNRFEDLDGMYLVGGGTHPGSGLPVIFESARISSRLLLEDLGMNADGSATPGNRLQLVPDPGRHPLAETVEIFSRLFHPRPAANLPNAPRKRASSHELRCRIMRIPIVFRDDEADLTAVAERAMTAARVAQARWSRTPLARRLELIREIRRLIAEHAPQLSEASASARQRPAHESLIAEVFPLAEACRFLEREAARILAPRRIGRRGRPLWLDGVHGEIRREPLGVILIIGPGNYPLLLPGVQLMQALAAGNAVLLKPGVGGAPAARAFRELVVRAGVDPQLVALLPESPEAARAAILARPDKVVFTGSAATGEKILAQLAPHLIPATMELSGCDAVIGPRRRRSRPGREGTGVRFMLNGGATCMSPKRVFVHRSLAAELEGRLTRRFSFVRKQAGFAVKNQNRLPAAQGICAR